MHRTIRLLAFFAALASAVGLFGHRRPLQADDVYRVASVRIPERGLRAYRPGEVIVQFKDGVPPYMARAKGDRLEIALGADHSGKQVAKKKAGTKTTTSSKKKHP